MATLDGTPFPRIRYQTPTWNEVLDAVCGVTRSIAFEVTRRGPARTLALKTAWAHGLRDTRALADAVEADIRAVQRVVRTVPAVGANFADPTLDACLRAVGDPRFHALGFGDLLPNWRNSKYGRLR